MSSSNSFSRIERDLIIQFILEKKPELFCKIIELDLKICDYSFDGGVFKVLKQRVLPHDCSSEKIKCSFYFNGRGVWFNSTLYIEGDYFCFEISKDIFKSVDLSPLSSGTLSLEGQIYHYSFKDTFIPQKPVFMDKEGQHLISEQTENWIMSQNQAVTTVSACQDSSSGVAFFFSANVIGLGFRFDSSFTKEIPARGSTGFITFKISKRLCKFNCTEKGSVVSNGFYVLVLELVATHPEDYRFLFELLYSETCPDLTIDDIIKKISNIQ